MNLRTLLFAVLALFIFPAYSQTIDLSTSEFLIWREIGPWRGGRSVACSGVPGRPNEFYMGTTGGGLWKTTNAGVDWFPVSDGFFKTGSVGGIGVSASNPDIVYVGMGETQIRTNISHGDGIYKSIDGGNTWTHLGLEQTRFISRVRVHPTNPDVVYVTALGHVYGSNPERGVYKTTDGGKTWTKILFVSEKAGAVDLCLDATNPDVIYAGTWEVYRTPYTLNSGGPGSKLFKSVDGGKTWKELTKNPGLPQGLWGKVGVSVSPANPKIVYAHIEALDGGVFRSDNGGETWQLTNDNRNFRQRAWYYTRIYADTKDESTVYVLNVQMGKSTDGGKTFRFISVPHSDNHDLWIDPQDNQRMINANDGGANVTTDGGRTWTEQDFPTAQFYHVTTDNAFPYNILGAQQDNSTVRIPSRTFGQGITRSDWTSTAGGESGYLAAKPDDPDIVFGGSYGGHMSMLNHRTRERRDVSPWPENPMGWGAVDLVYRFQWTYPILFSPHDPNVLYTSSQYLLKSVNMGESWMKISPDLTRNDPRTLQPSGGPITKDNTSAEYYATIFAVSESPITKGVIWCGSDDGLVHITRDGGVTWTNVTPSDMAEWGKVSIIESSPHNSGGAYIAIDNHKNNDYTPYIYRTDDYGRIWMKIVNGIPQNTFVRVVREDPKKKGLLYAGTEMGMFVSFDNGANWQSLQFNLPIVPIHDIAIKDDDIVVATHGRSFWVLDDITPLHQIENIKGTEKPILFKPKDAYRVRWGGNPPRDASAGNNPMSGVILSFYLPEGISNVKFEFIDTQGENFMSFERGGFQKGAHRVSTDLRYQSFRPVQGMIMWAAGARPIPAPPGEYIVRMIAGDTTVEQKFRLLRDPRSSSTDEDLIEQWRFAREISAKTDEANNAVLKIRDIKTKLDASIKSAKDKNLNTVIISQLEKNANDLKTKLGAVEEEIYQVRLQSGQDPLNYPIKLNNKIAALLGVVLAGDFRPTEQTYEVFDMLSKQLNMQLLLLEVTLHNDLSNFNARLKELGIDEVKSSINLDAEG